MGTDYDHTTIEKRWQERWEADGLYRSLVDWDRPKHYALTMLPYPSGDLHMGHWYAMTPPDARARFMRMKGYNVLFPMGFDSFGLPADNAASQRNIHPVTWTKHNIETMRTQMRSMGTMFDWEREVSSSDPTYYRWTEWFFKRFFEADLAYRGTAIVNWSETLQTVLANEQVIDGKDERTGQPVVQKTMSQWFFRMTKYADELLEYPGIDWPEPIKVMQRNWIGRSEGARVSFGTDVGEEIEVFTTRPDTLWGATFMVLAPEHRLVDTLTTESERATVEAYRAEAAGRTELERMQEGTEKTGVFTGGYATNPVNDKRIPIWIADYVLSTYGTGAIMAVPAHDTRDFAFARRFGLEIAPVVVPPDGQLLDAETMDDGYLGPGTMVNSGPIDGVSVNMEKGRKNPAVAAAIDWLGERGAGVEAVNYRLRDWLISRQRYWGAPIPMVYREDGTVETVPDDELPVLLPEDVDFNPSGRSPHVGNVGFVLTTDSKGHPARRETDTLDTFMCSSWYPYRYLSPEYTEGPFDPEEAAYWLPIDSYTGGAEHATVHLLYTRFFTKAMRDLGILDATADVMREHGRDPAGLFDEPMMQLRNQGQILGEGQDGDVIVANGTWDAERLVAASVRVDSDAAPDAGDVVGEITQRTERIIQVATARGSIPVEVTDSATIDIPSIPGDNTVNQLRHKLDVQRMSKTRGNVVNPDDLVVQHGADTVRTYLMFAFDWLKGGPWDSRGIVGARRFIEDVWKLGTEDYNEQGAAEEATAALRGVVHRTIAKVDRDMMDFKWNTAVAALMTLRNDMQSAWRAGDVTAVAWDEAVDTMLLLLAPVAPHVTEELWQRLHGEGSIHTKAWPQADPDIAREDTITMVVQVNGKVRARIDVPADISAEDAGAMALDHERIQVWLEQGEVRNVIARPPKLVNIVVQ